MFVREIVIAVVFWLGWTPPADSTPQNLSCSGQSVQSGLILCWAPPTSDLIVAGSDGRHRRVVRATAEGLATIGLRRTESAELSIRLKDSGTTPQRIVIAPRNDPFRTITGLDCDKVDARTEAQKAHAARSWVKKQAAFKTFSDGPGALRGFSKPARGPMSSPFGPARKYIGVGKDGEPCERTSIHRGYDVAIPVGTDIVAPAAGTITLADPDLYYEGGTVFLDHGHGLVSVFMHMSAIDVVSGQYVKLGERLGASGNTGRTTGPHLHWAVKWRNPNSDDRGNDFYIDPALLLDFTAAPPIR